MFHGGGPPGGRYPRQYAPRCRIPTAFEQPQGPRMATGFGPQFRPVSYNPPSRPSVPCGSFVPRQYERNQQSYRSDSEECRRYSTDKSEPLPNPGNNQGRQLNPSLPFAGFSVDPTQVSMGNIPLSLPAHTTSSQFNTLSQQHIENERAGEEFLRCLAAKEKYPVRDGVINRQNPHYRHPCPGNGHGHGHGQGQELKEGRSKSRPRSRSRSRGKSMGRSKSRPRSHSRGKSMGRSKSRARSRSCSQGKNMGRSKSRPPSRSRSPGRFLGRSKSRPRSRSRSPGKNLGRSKSRPRSQEKIVGRSNSRPRSRSHSPGKNVGKSCTQLLGRGSSRSCSGTSSSSSSNSSKNSTIECNSRTAPPSKKTALDMFRELLLAGQLNEKEELLNLAALKKELDIAGHGRPSTQTSHPSVNILGKHQSSSLPGSLPRETQSLLSAETKGMEPGLFASIPGQMRQQFHGQRVQAVSEDLNMRQYAIPSGSLKQETKEESIGEFLLPHERVSHDNSGFSRILGMMGNPPDMRDGKKLFTDIEDEEEFLYGDEVDTGKVSVKTVAAVGQSVDVVVERQAVDVVVERQAADVVVERQAVDVAEERQPVVDFEKIRKALTIIGLDLGTSEISKLMARKQEHLTGQIAESLHPMGTSSSGGLSPSQSHSLKRTRSPNPEIYSNSHSSAKQAFHIGASAGLVKTEFDTSTQEKQDRAIPFFRPNNVHQPLVTTKMSSPGSEAEIWGHSQLKGENSCLQKANSPACHAPDVDNQILGLGLGPLKEILETVKATTKAPGMDTLIDLANQSACMRTSQRKKNSEENAKVNEEALQTNAQEHMRRKDHLLKELESLLKREVSEFVVPVIGFCCQLCEEFFGDITSAQDHATCPSHKEKCKKHNSWNKKLAGNLVVRPSVDTGKQGVKESEHKWTSRDESKRCSGIGEHVSVKEEKLEDTRNVREVSGSSSAIPLKKSERKEVDSPRSSETDEVRCGEGSSSKAHKKKKKKKEKKKLKKEKKEKKRERKE